MNDFIIIRDKKIGESYPVFIVAELSANHLQKFDIAVDTIKAAKEAGADAIKLQTYTPDTLTIDCNNQYQLLPLNSDDELTSFCLKRDISISIVCEDYVQLFKKINYFVAFCFR